MTQAAQNLARKWSIQQDLIFAWFAGPSTHLSERHQNLVVRARAGTGKTTTILEGINHAPEESILLAAFNKKIAEELSARLKNSKAEAKTLHALGFGFVRRNWKGVKVDSDRGENLAREALKFPEHKMTDVQWQVMRLVSKLASKGKAMLIEDQGILEEVAVAFDHTPEEDMENAGWTVARIASAALRAMKLSLEHDGTIDFDDMIYVPVRSGWVKGYYSLVVIDEAQDMNASQLHLALNVCRKGGRIAVIGDDRQAIYAFRGADSGSIDRLKAELDAQELGLTITYRCPQTVVSLAQTLVPDFQAAPSAPQGQVLSISSDKLIEHAQPGSFILSRKNAPLVSYCLKILKAGKRAKIEGREIGSNLLTILKKIDATSINALITGIEEWAKKQAARRAATGKTSAEKQIEAIHDQADCLRALAEASDSVTEVFAKIENLFEEGAAGRKDFIVLSSVHKAKGLEAPTVYALKDTFYPGGKRTQEEMNIEYVAITRAQQRLIWVIPTGT